MDYLPEPKVSRFTRWAYAGCPGTSTEDLIRAPYARARGLSRWPDRLGVGRRSPVKHGYVEGSRAEAAAAAMGLSPLGTVERPFGTVAYVESPKPTVAARERKAYAVEPKPVELDGSKVVVLTPDQLAAVLRQKAGVIRMGEVD